ncbi:MAG: hypothetical protein KKH94_07640 [Candidatus Omnitrophica bacterium]|nr:hypothetical protein [Candidatus Omnitrophota bacterium]
MKIIHFLNNNIVTIFKAILIFIFIVSLASTLINVLFRNAWLQDFQFTALPFDETKEMNYVKHYNVLPRMYKERNQLARTYSITRNFFSPVQKSKAPAAPFYIKEIVFAPFVFIYMGHIEKSSSEIIAQINWGARTHFVREGDALKDWTVMQIKKENVIIMHRNGKEKMLPLHKRVFSEKPYAVVNTYVTEKEVKIYIGDEIEGGKVLDITKDTVIITANSGIITIKK